MLPLTLALYDSNDIQYIVSPERLRFTKASTGGMDVEMSFVLPLPLNIDYPYIGYGLKAELWYGLTRLFLSEQREIEQSKEYNIEGMNIRAVGYRAFLDDFSYADKGKLWCDTRYAEWQVAVGKLHTDYGARGYEMDRNERLYLAHKADHGNKGKWGGYYYECPFDEIKRVTFDWQASTDYQDGKFSQQLVSYATGFASANTEWTRTNSGSGSEDITLGTERPIIVFRIYDWGDARYWSQDHWLKITNLKIFGSTDTSPTASDVAIDIVSQIESDTLISSDISLIEAISLELIPLVFEEGQTCYDALKIVASHGDSNHKLFSWGVESAGDRMFVEKPDYATVRYVINPDDAARITRRGSTLGDFLTEGYGRYEDDKGEVAYTAKYYAHATSAGIVANTTSTGDDLSSTVFGVKRSDIVDFGQVSSSLATGAIQQYLIEHGHPQITSSIQIQGPVKDLAKGGAEIMAFEIEPGHLVQIPWFRAVEAEGTGDIREWDTTFHLAGMEYNHDSGQTRLIPEQDKESLERLLAYIRTYGPER